MEQEEKISMEIVNPHAAGIDIGSRSHWVGIGQHEKDVREFGVFNQDLFEMADWLHQNKIRTIAMESTGTYWQNLYAVLISKGFHVILCNGKFTKNIKGKKTDIKDCQWIQKLHSLGLLSSSFLPDGKTEQLRTYCRHRANLLHNAASTSKKMRIYLRLLNLRLDVVVNDICGLTGLLIIRAICEGDKDPQKLASLRHGNCRKSEDEIARALQSNGRKDYLFALQQELDTYDHLQKKITECDVMIEQMLNEIIDNDDNKKQHYIDPKTHKRINKKEFDFNSSLEKGYFYIKRAWSENDIVEIELPMSPVRIKSNPAVRQNCGRVAIQRGPLLYCLEETDNGENLNDIQIPETGKLIIEKGEGIFKNIPLIIADAVRSDRTVFEKSLYRIADKNENDFSDIKIKAIPYFMWANRKIGEMLVWIRE